MLRGHAAIAKPENTNKNIKTKNTKSADPTRNGQIQWRWQDKNIHFQKADQWTNWANKFNKLAWEVEWVKDKRTIPVKLSTVHAEQLSDRRKETDTSRNSSYNSNSECDRRRVWSGSASNFTNSESWKFFWAPSCYGTCPGPFALQSNETTATDRSNCGNKVYHWWRNQRTNFSNKLKTKSILRDRVSQRQENLSGVKSSTTHKKKKKIGAELLSLKYLWQRVQTRSWKRNTDDERYATYFLAGCCMTQRLRHPSGCPSVNYVQAKMSQKHWTKKTS